MAPDEVNNGPAVMAPDVAPVTYGPNVALSASM